ncbi:MAG: hypothetical protein R3208_05170 [Ketobacteraceae bacterium]|nr:hypothetical protein [Ketobacteraceae bacterium]
MIFLVDLATFPVGPLSLSRSALSLRPSGKNLGYLSWCVSDSGHRAGDKRLQPGVLADGYLKLKPEMAEGRSLAALFGPVWGVGENRGIALMISVFGMISLVFVVGAFMRSSIRGTMAKKARK